MKFLPFFLWSWRKGSRLKKNTGLEIIWMTPSLSPPPLPCSMKHSFGEKATGDRRVTPQESFLYLANCPTGEVGTASASVLHSSVIVGLVIWLTQPWSALRISKQVHTQNHTSQKGEVDSLTSRFESLFWDGTVLARERRDVISWCFWKPSSLLVSCFRAWSWIWFHGPLWNSIGCFHTKSNTKLEVHFQKGFNRRIASPPPRTTVVSLYNTTP